MLMLMRWWCILGGRMPAVGATVVRGLVAPRATDEATEQDVDATRAGAN